MLIAAFLLAVAQPPPALAAAADSLLALTQDGRPRDVWPDLSDSTRRAAQRRMDRVAAMLAAVPRASLTRPADRLLYDNVAEVAEASVAARVCRSDLWAGTNPFAGWHVAASNAARVIAVGGDSARARAVATFAALPNAVRAERALLQRGLDSGYTAARPVIAAVVKQLDDLLPDDPTRSPLWGPAERDTSAAFRERWAALLRDTVYPAGRAYRDWLSRDYLPRARAEGALAGLPNGAACYAAGLRAQTSARVNADSLIADARRALDRVTRELAPLARELTGERDVSRAVVALRTDPRFTFPARDSILPAYQAMTRRAAERIGRVVAGFGPESVVVAPYPAFQENAGLPPQYLRATNERPAQFLVNLSRTERMSVANAVAHEAYPGHHLQRIAEVRAPAIHPVMRTVFIGGFIEGWGIYAEDLADEMGLYETPLDRAGRLVHMLDVAVAAYLDVAYHTRGWTRQALVDTMMALGGRSRVSAEAYADRHAATPGQLATYYVGYAAIRAARADAERRLGARFDAPAFHNLVLRDGSITLASLRQKAREWDGSPPPNETAGRRGALAPGSLAIVGATVIPMTGDTVMPNATVLVRDGRVAAVGRGVRVPAGTRRVDGRGKFVIPGLTDAHTHLYSDESVPDSAGPAELGVILANGVTTARLMIGTPEQLALRAGVASGAVLGPQLWVASPQLTGRPSSNARVVTTPDAARAAVREAKEAGYDFVKLTLAITPEVYDAVVEEAARVGIRVVGHVDTQVGVARALRAGQQIEHLDAYFEGALADSAPMKTSVTQGGVFALANWPSLDFMDDRKIDALAGATARAGVWSSPTLNVFNSAFAAHESDADIRGRPDWRMIPPDVRALYLRARDRYWAPNTTEARGDARRRRYVEVRNRLVKAIHDSGGRVLAGSDTPEWFHAYGWGLHRELAALVQAGLTPYDALVAATRNAAEFLGQPTEWGAIAPGRRADLVVLDANPLADIRNTQRIRAVLVGGRLLDRAALDAMIARGSAAIGGAPGPDVERRD